MRNAMWVGGGITGIGKIPMLGAVKMSQDVPLTTMLYKDHITGSTVQAAAVTAVVDETLSANMKWDGTSISGKAEAGATITIEIQE